MLRFLLLAVPLLVLLWGVSSFALDALDVLPADSDQARFSLGVGGFQPRVVIGSWFLEAVGLTGLFLLAHRRAGLAWLDGLLAAWAAWIFRGPLLVLSVAGGAGLEPGPWWRMALIWLVVYSLGGLLLGILARRSNLDG